jgi:GxxExxY protein
MVTDNDGRNCSRRAGAGARKAHPRDHRRVLWRVQRARHGFVQSVYQRALSLALAARGIQSEREVPLSVQFRGEVVGDYRADLVVEGKVIVESKVAERILPVHEMQLLNYLRATGITVGLVLSFGPRPTLRRLLLTSPEEGSVLIRL